MMYIDIGYIYILLTLNAEDRRFGITPTVPFRYILSPLTVDNEDCQGK